MNIWLSIHDNVYSKTLDQQIYTLMKDAGNRDVSITSKDLNYAHLLLNPPQWAPTHTRKFTNNIFYTSKLLYWSIFWTEFV